MKNKIKIWVIMSLAIVWMGSCNQEKKEEKISENSSLEKSGQKKADTIGIYQERINGVKEKFLSVPVGCARAKFLTDKYKEYVRKNVPKSDTRYVVFDIASMRTMLDNFESEDGTHVKVYFGAEEYETSKYQLTVFFQNAVRIGSGNKYDDKPNPCDDSDLQDHAGRAPHDVGFPCPPPTCEGTSNWY